MGFKTVKNVSFAAKVPSNQSEILNNNIHFFNFQNNEIL